MNSDRIRLTSPPTVAAPVGRYSHVARVAAGTDIAFLSGQIGNLPDGSLAGSDLYAQTRQALRNLGELVTSLGATPRDLVKLFTMVVASDLSGFYAARTEVFDEWFGSDPPPTHSLAIVSGLATPDLLVEIEAVVAIPSYKGAP